MHLFPRLALFALLSVTLASCSAASGFGTMLGGAASTIGRTLGAVGNIGGSASIKSQDTTSEAIAERGKQIQERGDGTSPQESKGEAVALR